MTRNSKKKEILVKPVNEYPTEIIPKLKARKILDDFFLYGGRVQLIKRIKRQKKIISGYTIYYVARSTEELDLIRNSLYALFSSLHQGRWEGYKYLQPLYDRNTGQRYIRLRDKLRGTKTILPKLASPRKPKINEIQVRPVSEYPTEIIPEQKARQVLDDFFLYGGYTRIRTIKRDNRDYAKGYETRFVARSGEELDLIRNSLLALNYRLSKGYFKSKRFIQPVYSKDLTLRNRKLKDKLREKI